MNVFLNLWKQKGSYRENKWIEDCCLDSGVGGGESGVLREGFNPQLLLCAP